MILLQVQVRHDFLFVVPFLWLPMKDSKGQDFDGIFLFPWFDVLRMKTLIHWSITLFRNISLRCFKFWILLVLKAASVWLHDHLRCVVMPESRCLGIYDSKEVVSCEQGSNTTIKITIPRYNQYRLIWNSTCMNSQQQVLVILPWNVPSKSEARNRSRFQPWSFATRTWLLNRKTNQMALETI